VTPKDAERAFNATFGPGAWDEAAHTPIYPCVLCGASPDLGQAHDPTCLTQHAAGTVYDDYEAVRGVRNDVHERGLNVGAWVSVAVMIAVAVLLVILVEATKGDHRCVVRLGSDGAPVSVCTPEAPKTRHGS